MRKFIVLSAAAMLAACGSNGSDTQSSDANMAASDNMMMDQNMAMDPMMNGSGNMAMDPMMNGTMNGSVNSLDPATQNMIKEDMNTNAPDTNLANGM